MKRLFLALVAIVAAALLLSWVTATYGQDPPSPDINATPAPAATVPAVPNAAQAPDEKPVELVLNGKKVKVRAMDQGAKERISKALIEQGEAIIALQNNELAYRTNKDKLEADKQKADDNLQKALIESAKDQKIDTAKNQADVKNWVWAPLE